MPLLELVEPPFDPELDVLLTPLEELLLVLPPPLLLADPLLPLELPELDEEPLLPESSSPDGWSDGAGWLDVPPYGPPRGLGSPLQPVQTATATRAAAVPVERLRLMYVPLRSLPSRIVRSTMPPGKAGDHAARK
jgi:hypothetical protein